jgi:hypothetical protein
MPSLQALQGDDLVIGDPQFVDRGAKPELENAAGLGPGASVWSTASFPMIS